MDKIRNENIHQIRFMFTRNVIPIILYIRRWTQTEINMAWWFHFIGVWGICSSMGISAIYVKTPYHQISVVNCVIKELTRIVNHKFIGNNTLLIKKKFNSVSSHIRPVYLNPSTIIILINIYTDDIRHHLFVLVINIRCSLKTI